MSQHSSLKSASASVKHRNVLKRYERLRALNESEKWGDRTSVYNLPKLKMIKLKVKKSKEVKEGEGEAGEKPAAQAAPPSGDAKAADKGKGKAKA